MCHRFFFFIAALLITQTTTAQRFGDQQMLSTEAWGTRSVHSADLDGDGDLDVISASKYDDKIAWYENLGGGNFGDQQIISTQTLFASSVYAADLDGDGDLDVLSASENDDKIAWYENLGGDGFGDQQIISTQVDGAYSVHAADLDGDGNMDVLSASRADDKIAWYKNQGGGIFDDQQIISNQAVGARSVHTADLDGDGDLDVLSASFSDDKIACYENLGGGAFGIQQIISTEAEGAWSVHTGDLDGDGDMDVLSASQNDDKIAWYENQGGSSFGTQLIISTQAKGARAVYTADLDGDGDVDVLSASSDDDKIAWYENLDDGLFGPQQIISSQVNGPKSVYTADLDNDGDLDVLSASGHFSSDQGIAWHENKEEIHFGDQQIISTQASAANSVYSADLNGDGDMDVLSASGDDKIAWYENLGGGSFGDQQVISTQAEGARSVHSADLDGDGDMDVLSASSDDHKIAWYENLGGGLFGDQQVISLQGSFPRSVYSTDLDGDGDMDVLSASWGVGKIAWYENLGESGFGPQQIISTEVSAAHSVRTADLDGDGDMDVLSASYNKIAWYENLGGALFDDQQIITTNIAGAKSVHTADLNGDGDLDVLSASDVDNKIAWYENLGGGGFGDQQTITTQVDGAWSVFTADLDGDGDMDVLSASEWDDKIAWYENQGGGLFGDQQIISKQAINTRSVYSADLDGDGDMDVLSASGWDDKIAWYDNLMGNGCTDPSACNYDPGAWIENNSCCYECGCTVAGAENYSTTACLDDGTCKFPVLGRVFFDENENGVMDGDEYGLPFQEVGLLPDSLLLVTNDNGYFFINVSGSDAYTFELVENSGFPFFTTSQSLAVGANEDNWNQDTLYFGVSNELPAFDLQANMYSVLGGFPCDDYRGHYLCFRNTSNVPIDVQLEFHYDSLFQDIIQSAQIDSLGANVAYLSISDVAPFELICEEVELLSPTVEFIGEFLETSMEVRAFYDGEEVAFGADSLSEELSCAYDPNDKQVFPEGYSEAHYIANDTILEYLVRFQNTGNAPATDVIVRDTLDPHLDLETFKLVVNSHSVFTTVDPTTRELEFYFQNIMLPDSVSNEPESHGLVSFTIRPEAGLPLLTELNNTAAIYFDNNPPIITNTTWSTIYDCSLFDVSFTDNGALLTASEGDHFQWFLDGEPIEGATEQEYMAFMTGSYSVQVDIDFPCLDTSGSTFILVTAIDEWEGKEIKLFPNPMTTSALLDLGELRGPIRLEIYDILGKLQRSEFLTIESGTLGIERGALSSGTYILRLIQEEEAMDLKFVVE